MGSRTRNFANNVASTGRPINIDVTEFDDNKLVNDLSTLGLRVHTQENLTASNTNSQYVDTVPYTHLTLATKKEGESTGGAGTIKKKTRKKTEHRNKHNKETTTVEKRNSDTTRTDSTEPTTQKTTRITT